MDRLHALGIFVAVAELRSFSAAARRRGMSPTAATRAIAALEAHLDAKLLRRTTRSVSLTPAGTRLLARARRVLDEIDHAESEARGSEAHGGHVRISAPQTFGRIAVVPALAAYMEAHPQVTVELSLYERTVSAADRSADVVVRVGSHGGRGTVSPVVGTTRRVIVASPAYLRAHDKIRAPIDLADHVVAQFTPLTPAPEWELMTEGRRVMVRVVPALVTNSPDAALEYVLGGRGVSMLMSYQVREHVAAGRLVPLLVRHETAALPIVLSHRKTGASEVTRGFAAWAAANLRWDFSDLDSRA